MLGTGSDPAPSLPGGVTMGQFLYFLGLHFFLCKMDMTVTPDWPPLCAMLALVLPPGEDLRDGGGPVSTCLLVLPGSHTTPCHLWQGHRVGTLPGSSVRPAQPPPRGASLLSIPGLVQISTATALPSETRIQVPALSPAVGPQASAFLLATCVP